MLKLNFPDCDIKVKLKQNKPYVFDVVRKKWIRLTPEEWVRTHCIQFLNQQKNFPISLLRIEQQFNVFDRQKRFDLIACNSKQEPLVLVECKSPEVKIRQNTFDQLSRYNVVLKSPYSMITNGLNHYFYTVNFDNQSFQFIEELPNYNELK
ncbi:MAG: type I restriction enzyme HsdR N-terminal domain-containing protein [Flavobacteriaceae bacterium]|jgi:hypothetical protein|nr:type I restriction enzyme HsdR N-terminal domain-containing protein [Flavobacteriaceae bacterium]|tara:strand:+ start:417 stop:869 length:453 start_codon:yes stop_codon:yes gene_type:complete